MVKRQWQTFLRRVWGSGEGWAFLAYVAAGEFKQKAFQYPDQLEMLVREAEQLNGWASVYFCTHLCRTSRSRTRENALPARIVWVDKDKGLPEELQPKPTICWQTSSGRYQAVWVLNESAPPDRVEQANRHLAYTYGGDKGKWPLSTVFRLPGSTNHKYTPPQEGFVLWDNGPIYTIDDLMPPVTKAEALPIPEGEFPELPTRLPATAKVLRDYGAKIPPAAWDLMSKELGPGEDWSESLWRLERLLFEAGLPAEAVLVVARDSTINKYARDGRPDSHLWVEIVKASRETRSVEEVPTVAPALPWMGLRRLMGYSERPSWLVEGIWIAKNVGWLAGLGKSYKSILAIELALSVASGKPFLGTYRVMDPGPVLVIQEEDPPWRVAWRFQLIAKQKGIATLEVNETDFSMLLEVPNIPIYVSVGGGFLLTDSAKVKALEADVARIRPRLILIDPFFMVSSGIDEYKAGEVTPILSLLKRWRNDYHCAIGVVHHYRKSAGDARERLYGSMALYAWSENSLFFNRKGNVVVIERDIKDALVEDRIVIEMQDIEEEYRYMLKADVAAPLSGDAEAKVKAFLATCGLGRIVPMVDLAEGTGLTRRQISAIVKGLEVDGLVEVERKGQGGQLRVKVLTTLLDVVEEERLVL